MSTISTHLTHLDSPTDIVDPEPRLAHPDGGPLHLHRRRALPGVARARDGDVDAAGEVRAGAGRGQVRVPGVHGAQNEPLRLLHGRQ